MKVSGIAILLLALFSGPVAAGASLASAQENDGAGDRKVILQQSFDGKLIKEAPPAGANGLEKAAWFVYQQLTGRDFYRPENYMFFGKAVKEIGFFPAVFATADRILRDSRIGTASTRLDTEHPTIEEGPEAYAPGRGGRDGK